MSVFDDGQHGIWGMSYKYHERAIVFNEKNLLRMWDVAYDGAMRALRLVLKTVRLPRTHTLTHAAVQGTAEARTAASSTGAPPSKSSASPRPTPT